MRKTVVGRKWSSLLTMYGVLSVLCLAIYFFEDSRTLIKNLSLGIAIGAPALIAALFFLTALHEGGHLVAAKLGRMRVEGFCVGPLRWLKVQGQWRFSWYDDTRIGGFILAEQVDGGFDRRKYLGMFAGGPIGSIVGLGIALLALAVFPQYRPIALGVVGLAAMFTLSLVPMRTGGLASDGYWILQLWLKPEEAAKQLATMLLGSLTRADVPTREWPVDKVRSLRDIQGNTMEAVAARIYEFTYAVEMEDDELGRRAAEELETAYATVDFVDPTGVMKAVVLLDIALSKALFDHDAARAREILSRIEHMPDQALFVKHQVMALVHALEGDAVACREAADWALYELDKQLPDRPRVREEAKRRLESTVERACQARTSAAAPSPASPPPFHP